MRRSRHSRSAQILAIAACGALLFAACGDDDTETGDDGGSPAEGTSETTSGSGGQPTAEETLTIVAATEQSGPLAIYSESMVNGYTLAIDEINAAGGVVAGDTTYTLELEQVDTGAEAAQGVAIVQQALSDDTPVLMGFGASAVLAAAAPVAAQAGDDLLLFPVGTLAGLTEQGDNIFRNRQPTGTEQHSEAFWTVMSDLEPERIGIFVNNSNPVYLSAQEGVEAAAEADGVEVVAVEQFSVGTTDFAANVSNMRSADPDAVLILANPPAEITGILNEMQLQGLEATPITNDAALFDLMLSSAQPGALEGLHSVAVASNDVILENGGERAAAFFESYSEAFGDAGTYSAAAYDDIHILAAAIEAAGSAEPADIMAALEGLDAEDVDLVEATVETPDGKLFDESHQVIRPYVHYLYGPDGPTFVEFISAG